MSSDVFFYCNRMIGVLQNDFLVNYDLGIIG